MVLIWENLTLPPACPGWEESPSCKSQYYFLQFSSLLTLLENCEYGDLSKVCKQSIRYSWCCSWKAGEVLPYCKYLVLNSFDRYRCLLKCWPEYQRTWGILARKGLTALNGKIIKIIKFFEPYYVNLINESVKETKKRVKVNLSAERSWFWFWKVKVDPTSSHFLWVQIQMKSWGARNRSRPYCK